jgi:hypothetical protein
MAEWLSDKEIASLRTWALDNVVDADVLPPQARTHSQDIAYKVLALLNQVSALQSANAN